MNRFKVIFFDAAGTLFHVKGSVGEVYLSYAVKYGVPLTKESLDAVNAGFHRALQEAPPPIFAVGDPARLKQCERLWWFDVVHTVFYRVGMFQGFDDYFEEIYQAFNGPFHWALYPETLDVLKVLKGKGLELGLISNFDTRIFSVLGGLGLSELLDTVTISSLAKAAKPSRQIFRVAMDKHVVDPEEAIHVGDSLKEDVEGAQGVGMAGVWVNRQLPEELGDPPPPFTGPTVRTLSQLPELILAWDK